MLWFLFLTMRTYAVDYRAVDVDLKCIVACELRGEQGRVAQIHVKGVQTFDTAQVKFAFAAGRVDVLKVNFMGARFDLTADFVFLFECGEIAINGTLADVLILQRLRDLLSRKDLVMML